MSVELIAKMLKNARIDASISVKEVVEYLSALGICISPKTIYGWEMGRSQPDIDTFLALCQYYNIHPENFSKLGRDIIADYQKKFPSDEALEVAKAYDGAERRPKDTVRLVLGLTDVADRVNETENPKYQQNNESRLPPMSENVKDSLQKSMEVAAGVTDLFINRTRKKSGDR